MERMPFIRKRSLPADENELPAAAQTGGAPQQSGDTEPAKKKDRFAATRKVLETRKRVLGESNTDTIALMKELAQSLISSPFAAERKFDVGARGVLHVSRGADVRACGAAGR